MERSEQERRSRDEARDMLRGELREVVGPERAERAEREGALDEAVGGRPKTVIGALEESRELIVITFFVALVVGAVIALIVGAWWVILIALALHAIGTVAVVGMTFSLASRGEHPDPRTVAALEARGVADPDAALEHAVEVATEGERGHEGGETSATREPGTRERRD